DYGDSEFAGPAAYALGVLAFSQKDYNAAQPLFHRAAARSKDVSVALSAKYFEARCLESMKRTDEALALYLQVAEANSELPDDAKPEALLLVGNAQRQLGHSQQAEDIYRQIIEKFPNREEAKDARYQRLINLYNSDPNAVIAEVDEFLKTNPTAERADQAKLLKAEALYKQQKFAEAGPFYEELRASQLALNLRSEAAYKLG